MRYEDEEDQDWDEEIYTIYEVCGQSAHDLYLLVHRIEDLEDPDTLSSEIYRYQPQHDKITKEFETEDWLTSLCQTSSGILYASSAEGDIYCNQSGVFQVETSLGKNQLLTFIGTLPQGQLYCAEASGLFFAKNLDKWEKFLPKPPEPLWCFQGFSPEDFYALGQKGKVFHFNGSSWNTILHRPDCKWTDLLCISPQEIYLCGQNVKKQGIFLAGTAGTFLEKNLSWTPTSLAYYQNQIFVAGGEDGIFKQEQQQFVPFAPKIFSYGLLATKEALISFGENFLSIYQAGNWKTQEFDFAYL